jgi:hypothetical protein
MICRNQPLRNNASRHSGVSASRQEQHEEFLGEAYGLARLFKNGNELSELLIEGDNPYGARQLAPSDVSQIKPHLQASEHVIAYVLGRVALAGRGLWVLTDQHLMVSSHDSDAQVQRIKLSEISTMACVKGKYGFTLRATVGADQLSVYGASPHMAAMFYREAAQRSIARPS